jgi:Tol biopolymer transport system component
MRFHRDVLLRFSVTSTLFVYCSSGDPYPPNWAVSFNVQPSWSSDGDRVAYVHQGGAQGSSGTRGSESTSSQEIWVYSFSTDASMFWTLGTEPAWSPSGERLAYIGADGHLWTATAPDDPDAKLVATLSGASSPRWSPDGRLILFRRELAGRSPAFYVVKADGSGLISTKVEGVAADFLGDGETLVYAQLDEKTLSTVEWRSAPHLPAFVASIAPGTTHFLQSCPWSGDISYCRVEEKGFACWVMSSLGQQPRSVSDCAGTFSWSPDGTKVVLEREESGSIDLWVLNVSTNRRKKLLPDPAS